MQRRVLCVSQLRSICLRHLSFSDPLTKTTESEVTLPDLFVRLVAGTNVLYESDIAKETLNPTWPPVELDEHLGNTISPYEYLQDTLFELIVYRHTSNKVARDAYIALKEEDEDQDEEYDAPLSMDNEEFDGRHDMKNFEEVLRFTVRLDALEQLNCDYRELYGLPLNTLILGFQLDKDSEQYFVQRDIMLHLVQSGTLINRRRKEPTVRESRYSLRTAANLLKTNIGLLAEIEQRKSAVQAKRELIEQKLSPTAVATEKEHRRLQLQNTIIRLRKEVEERKQVQSRVKSVVKVEKQLLTLDERIPRTLSHLIDINNKTKEEHNGLWERRTEVLKIAHKIRSKQAHLVVQLHEIYPISYVGAGEYCIGGVKFMNADITNGKDDEMLSTALGYIAHFVFMLAKYLDVNLRYTIVHYSSRSYMRDDVNDAMTEYPLYKRGVEKERFEKAFVFLKKDVDQLLMARGIECAPSSPILVRLKALVDAELAWLQANSLTV